MGGVVGKIVGAVASAVVGVATGGAADRDSICYMASGDN